MLGIDAISIVELTLAAVIVVFYILIIVGAIGAAMGGMTVPIDPPDQNGARRGIFRGGRLLAMTLPAVTMAGS